MFHFIFPAIFTPDNESGGYVVTFPDVPPAITEGNTFKEALKMAEDCLEEAIAAYISENLSIPKASRAKKGQHAIHLSAGMSAKAALYVAVSETGVSKTELARRLGVDEKEVRRMLSPRHQTKLSRIEKGLASLGYQLSVSLQKAA